MSVDLKFLKTKPYKVHRPYNKYQDLWLKLEAPTAASTYLAELITKTMHLEAYKKSIKQDDQIELEMISLMYGLALNYQIGDLAKPKEDKLKKAEQHPFIHKIISNIFKLLIDQQDIIGSIISQACFAREFLDEGPFKIGPDIFAHYKNVRALSDHVNPFYQSLRVKELEIVETGEFSFVYEHIVKYLKRNRLQVTPEFIEGIRATGKSIMMSLRETPESAQVAASALSHLLRQVITFYPINELEILKEFASVIETFRKWPLPAGYMADSCFRLIMGEMKSPGASLRDHLRDNFPLLDFLKNENESHQETLSHVVGCVTEESFEIDDIMSYNHYFLETESKLDAHQVRALIISYVFTIACGNNNKGSIMEIVSELSVKDVFMTYTRIMHILEKTSELNNISDCRSIQRSAFEELLKEIQQIPQITFNKTSLVKLFKENPMLVVPVPHAEFKILNQFLDKGKESMISKRSSSPFSSKQMMKEQLSSTTNKTQFFSILNEIQTIIRDSKRPNMPLHESPVKFMVIGGETEIFGFVQDLMTVYTNDPVLFRRIDLRVYLVPTSYSPIAQYIASHDFWYQRYIYYPFKSNPIIPKIENINKNQTESQSQGKSFLDNNAGDKRLLFPAIIKENLMQTYIREANYKFSPVIYQAKCYTTSLEDIKGFKPDKTFYFFQYIDIGAGVLRYKQRIERKLSPETPFYELEGNKLIKKFYLDLKIRAEYCEMSGYTHKSEEVVVRSIHDMSISNIPREYTRSTLPFPTSGWLEVSYLDFENFKWEDNAMKDKDKFKKVKPEHVNAAFSALYTNIHVTTIELWTDDKDQMFELVIDGNLCGPCKRVDISPVILKNGLSNPYFTLPIMNFMPIQM